MGIKHQNVVQFLGFCAESSSVLVPNESGEKILAYKLERFLCFEYISKGSLDRHISSMVTGYTYVLYLSQFSISEVSFVRIKAKDYMVSTML